jgi:pilus assembly protein CpaC
VIREFRQIQIDVIVAEISLTKVRELGVDIGLLGKHTAFLSRAGSQGGFSGGDLFTNPTTFPPTTTFGGGTSAVLSHVTNNIALTTVYRLFQDKQIAEILAQPQLVMKNGRSGGFLAGGEVPIPFATIDRINIEFKPFGVRLDFVPTITWSDTIDLRIFPEVSEIDPSVSITFGGVSVPGLRVRRSVNRIEMREGETLILSGLLDRRTFRDLTKIPFLGDLPILGALFRTTRFRNQETELVFVVTPRIVKSLRPGVRPPLPSLRKYDDPDFRQIPVPTPPAPVVPRSSVPLLPAPGTQPSLQESPLGESAPRSRLSSPAPPPQTTSPMPERPVPPDSSLAPPSSVPPPPAPASSQPPASHTMP